MQRGDIIYNRRSSRLRLLSECLGVVLGWSDYVDGGVWVQKIKVNIDSGTWEKRGGRCLWDEWNIEHVDRDWPFFHIAEEAAREIICSTSS